MVGVVMQNVEIDGLVTNLTVNGVEVMPYVEAELDRRHPVRLLIRSEEPGDLRKAWRQLGDDWATTIERVRSMPEGSEHDGVDGEWSMVETLRHLVFVHDSWFRRCVLGLTEPFTAMGLASPFVPGQEELGLDQSARPGLDEVLIVRDRQASEVEAWLAEVTPERLAQPAPVPATSPSKWARPSPNDSHSPRRCRTTTDGRRMPRAGACSNALALCSTRNGNTTASACATWTSCRGGASCRTPQRNTARSSAERTFGPILSEVPAHH